MYCFLFISLFSLETQKKRHEVAISPFCMTAKNAIDEINCKCRNGRNESVLTTTFKGVVREKVSHFPFQRINPAFIWLLSQSLDLG